MISTKTQGTVISTSLLSAIAASLCCITPVIALLAGSSSVAANFSWIEPARPYLIALSIATLALAWYQKLKPAKQIDINCDCDIPAKTSFLQSTTFLVIITIFSLVMITFPIYAKVLYGNTGSKPLGKQALITDKQTNFTIKGMTCESCEIEINNALSKVPGVTAYTTSYAKGASLVTYDPGKVNESEITKRINETGYTVTGLTINNSSAGNKKGCKESLTKSCCDKKN
ncbi:MAG: mercuric transport protein MerTP [Bacteroidota bacterium]|jgi:mercuric ion transport protein